MAVRAKLVMVWAAVAVASSCAGSHESAGKGAHGAKAGDDASNSGSGVPPSAQGCGSCDGGATTTCDENADCDGWCFGVESGYYACDDCPYPQGSDQRNEFCKAPGSSGEGEGEGASASEGEGANGGEGEGAHGGEGEGAHGGEGEGASAGEGEGEGPAQCATVTFSPGAANLEPRILFLVDKSGSMADPDNSGQEKYAACKSAIEQVSNNLNGSIDMGLMHFPGNSDADACSQGVLDVNVGPNTAGSIANVLESTTPGGGTPTAVSLLQAKAALDALPSQGGPRAIVLATDGGPNCNASLDGNTCRCTSTNPGDCQLSGGEFECLDDSNTVAAAQQVTAAGYSVFVIGEVGSENFTDVLNALAVAGGTALSGAVSFYQASDETELVTDLEQIAVRVGACRIDLGQSASATQVSVTVNGAPVSRDTSRTDGWDLVDAHTVELFGQPCDDTVNGGAQATVAVQICGG
jgi:hypothetical protein